MFPEMGLMKLGNMPSQYPMYALALTLLGRPFPKKQWQCIKQLL